MKRFILLLLCLFCATMAAAGNNKGNKDQESGAVGAMRSIKTAQKWYAKTYPQEGFACKLDTLGSGKTSDVPSAEHAGLLDSSLSAGTVRNGYLFAVSCSGSDKPSQHYRSTATPTEKSMTAFCSDETGVIRSIAGKDVASCFEKGQDIQNPSK